jgi:type I restriction enzyme S subunit
MSSKAKTTAMTNEHQRAFTPKLRFPEFRAATGWKQIPLEDCLDYLQPTPYLVTDTKYSPTFKTPVLTAGKTFILGYTDDQHGIFSEGLPVIIFDDFTTATQFVDFPFKAKSSAMKILQAKNGADIKFMYETLQFISYEIGAHERHWISNFAPMLVPAPTLAEQQKIADCLTSVDELIAAQVRKVGALKIHKKGLMQQLFPREGETQPRSRFPEFQNAGDWEKVSLGDYFDPVRNGFVGTATPYYTTSDGVRYLQGRNIKEGQIKANNLIYITDVFHQSQRKSHLKLGDLLMVQSGHVGECATVGSEFAGCNCHALIIMTPKRKLSSEFFVHYFYSPIGKLAILQFTTGNTIKHILASDLKEMKVVKPSLAEQQRIAGCLTSLDDLVTTENQKLGVLKTHKKGLMQQLFPLLDEA